MNKILSNDIKEIIFHISLDGGLVYLTVNCRLLKAINLSPSFLIELYLGAPQLIEDCNWPNLI